jgi:hypothetical protein
VLLARVPNAIGEHAALPATFLHALLLVQMNQNFCVALRGKPMAFRQQEVPNFGVIVTFPLNTTQTEPSSFEMG